MRGYANSHAAAAATAWLITSFQRGAGVSQERFEVQRTIGGGESKKQAHSVLTHTYRQTRTNAHARTLARSVCFGGSAICNHDKVKQRSECVLHL